MRWTDFEQDSPDLARRMRERFDATGVVFVGTLRRDGSPRISPVEHLVWDGDLWLGMMWQSKKALDLERDPRLEVHATIRDKDDATQFKLRGRAVDVRDQAKRDAYAEQIFQRIGWRPPEPFHLFTVDIESATHIGFSEGGDDSQRVTQHWTAAGTGARA